jgi:3-oxoacyl-[acyl-carrier protein] reductase
MMAFDFSGQVIVITGGSGGIGSATAKLFMEAGASVISADLKNPLVESPATEPSRHESVRYRFVEVDVANFTQVGACVANVLEKEGKVDCLINNAGIARDAVVWKMTEENWDRVLAVNLKGAFNFIHHLAAHFRQRQQGKIVNVSSINGLRGKFGLANYAASKAGLIGLTKTVAKELGRYNVNVNAVAPGMVETPLIQNLPDDVLKDAVAETVLNRLAAPQDIAHLILFLCSDYARHITGEVIKIDGGQYI